MKLIILLVAIIALTLSLGCKDETSCMQEITGALGAFGVEHMIYGNLGKVGSRYSMNLVLIDTGDARVVRRATIRGKGSIDALLDKLPALAAKIMGKKAKPTKGKVGVEWVYSKPAGLSFTKSEVTLGQFEKCVSAGACKEKNQAPKIDKDYCNRGYSDRNDHPMNCVDWYGARDFCKWVGGRLPSEHEWYKEASNVGSQKYPWGGEKATCARAVRWEGSGIDSSKWGCGRGSTWTVCSKPSGNSVSGLCDMSGNLWEWTSSQEGSSRVLRGGS